MKTRKKLLSLAVAAACSPATVVLAVETEGEESTLKHVVVSATKMEQDTSEAPANVSVVTAKDIKDSNVVRLGDALTAQVPSLFMRGGAVGTSSRDGGTSIISLRGAYGARTKVVVDGLASLADANSANPNLSVIGLDEVERIEVVPGVSSSLYGSDAIGGVINIITKVPTKREITARVGRGFGDGDRTTFEAGFRDRWSNGFGVSLSLYDQEMGGYAGSDLVTVSKSTCGVCTTPVTGWTKTTDNLAATKYIVGDKGAIPTETQKINGSVFFDLSANAKLKAGVTHYKSDQGVNPFNNYLNTALPASNLVIDGGRVASLTEYPFLNTQNQRNETRYFAGFEGKLGTDYLLKLDVSKFDREYSYESPKTSATFSSGAGTMTETPNTAKDFAAQLSFPIGDKQFLVAGLAVNKQSLNRKVYELAYWRDDGSKTTLNDQGDGYSQTKSIYLQDQISVGSALTIYAGARYDDWNTEGFVAKWVGGVTPPTTIPEHGEAALSPRLALVYKLSDAVSLKSSVGTAFRAPNLYDMYAADTISGVKYIVADANLKPEKAKSMDIGTEITLGNGVNFKAAAFYTRISDLIYSKETPYSGPYSLTIPTTITILSQKTNAAEAVTKGVELSGDFPLTSWLTGSASYTWTDARITKDDTGTGLLDKKLVYVPKNMASLGLRAKYQNWSGSLTTRYSGLMYTNASNSDVEKNVFTGSSKFWLTDLKLGYRFGKNLDASLMVNNLFDELYYEYYRMPGRNVAIELAAKF